MGLFFLMFLINFMEFVSAAFFRLLEFSELEMDTVTALGLSGCRALRMDCGVEACSECSDISSVCKR